MSHNISNGGTFGVDIYAKVMDQKTMKTSTHYSITDYEGTVNLHPSDAILASIMILEDAFERNLFTDIQKPSSEQLAELKAIIEKITHGGMYRVKSQHDSKQR